MRYPLTTLLFILSFCFLLNSCQKEISPEGGNIIITPPAFGDSSYLSKIYYVYYDASGVDTAAVFTYTYDNLKRVIALTDSTSDPAAPNPYIASTYYYNGNDTLPFKTRTYTSETSYYDTTITFHFYDVSGKKTKDSILKSFSTFPIINHYSALIVSNYSYVPGKIYGFTSYSSTSSTLAGYKDTAVLDAKGNLTSNKKYKLDPSNSPNYELYVVSNIAYNNNPSPFSKLSNFKSYIVFPFGETFYEEFVQNNNRTHIDEITIFGAGSTHNYAEDYNTYYYNTNGYPKEVFSQTATDSTRFIFKYRSF